MQLREAWVEDNPVSTFTEATTLWRLRHRDGDTARATLIPGAPRSTLVYFVNDEFTRGENFLEWEPALRQAARVKADMLASGWSEEEPSGGTAPP